MQLINWDKLEQFLKRDVSYVFLKIETIPVKLFENHTVECFTYELLQSTFNFSESLSYKIRSNWQ